MLDPQERTCFAMEFFGQLQTSVGMESSQLRVIGGQSARLKTFLQHAEVRIDLPISSLALRSYS
jgi:hypothetical protein